MAYDFSLSEPQELFLREAGRVIDETLEFDLARIAEDHGLDHTAPAWRVLAALGYAALCVSERRGGAGLGVVDLALFGERLGRRAAPLPLLWHNAALRHIEREAGDRLPTGLLADLVAGRSILTLAHLEANDQPEPEALRGVIERTDGGLRVMATKYSVPFAGVATHFLVSGRLEGSYATVLVPAAEATLTSYRSAGRDGRAIVVIDAIVDDHLLISSDDGAALRELLDVTRLALCGLACGAAQAATEMTAAYARDRVIFGKPLGSFEAVGQRAADMLFELEAGRILTLDAAWQMDEGPVGRDVVSAACAWVGPGCQRVAASAHQLHGAIGFTFEHNLHLLTTLVKATAADLGREDRNREAVAVSLGI